MTGHAQGSPEWLAERRTMIGASEAAAAMGLSPWCTPLELYRRKRGEMDEIEETMAMRRGKALEPVILEAYRSQHLDPLDHWSPSPPIYRHALHPYMGASLDAIGGVPLRVIEAKSVSFFTSRGFGEPGTDEVPEYYLVQVQHQLEVALSLWPDANPVAHLVALVDGEDEIRVYPIRYCPEIAHAIVDAVTDLWTRIQEGRPPDPTCRADIESLYPRSADKAITATPQLVLAWSELMIVRSELKAMAEKEEALAEEIQLAMKDADTLVSPTGDRLVTWKTGKARRSLDAKALAAAHPDLIEKFTKNGKAARPFLPKERKS